MNWEKNVRAVFEEIKKLKTSKDFQIANRKIRIYPNVFSPAIFSDSEWFATTLPKIVKNKSLLEIGTGTGIIALFCALKGAKVTATDLSKGAVKNAKYNFKKYNIQEEVLQGDIYSPIQKEQKFDFIFWNHPFNKGKNPNEEILLKSGFDYNYLGLEKYVAGAKNYLKKTGRLLLGSGNFADTASIKQIASENKYKLQILKRVKKPIAADKNFDNEYYIYELIKN